MQRVRRSLTWGLVAAVAISGITGIEAWPLTGWRLFSSRRQPVSLGYEARAVDRAGREAPVPFDRLPSGYSGWDPLLERMAGQDGTERDRVCAAWAAATADLTGAPVAEVRVYRVADDRRDGSRRSWLAWACAGEPG